MQTTRRTFLKGLAGALGAVLIGLHLPLQQRTLDEEIYSTKKDSLSDEYMTITLPADMPPGSMVYSGNRPIGIAMESSPKNGTCTVLIQGYYRMKAK